MHVAGAEHMHALSEKVGFSAKMVFNGTGAIVFPASLQHRHMKGSGISYEDDYRGNALAAMLMPGRIEIRFHKRFSRERVANVVRALLAQEELSFMRSWQVTYQGRVLSL